MEEQEDLQRGGPAAEHVEGSFCRLLLQDEPAAEDAEGSFCRLLLQDDAAVEGGEGSFCRLLLQDDPIDEEAEDSDEDGEADEGVSIDKSSKLNRAERKSRRALQKLGMKPLTGVNRVTIVKRRLENEKILVSFSKPDVFKFPSSDNYAIFGVGTIEELGATMPVRASQLDTTDLAVSAELTDEDEYDTNDMGIKPEDIDVVMAQADVCRWEAVKALRDNEGDVVGAILDLTD